MIVGDAVESIYPGLGHACRRCFFLLLFVCLFCFCFFLVGGGER